MPPRNKPLTAKEVTAKIAQLPNVILLSTYEASNKKVKCRCRQCRYEWTPIWSNLIRGKGCPRCSLLRKGITEISAELARLHPTLKLLSKEYTGVYDHLKLECTVCGHKWTRSWHKLKSGKGCPKCQADTQKMSMSTILQVLSVKLPSVQLLSNVYENALTPLKCKCNLCGYKWVSNWARLQRGCGCIKCSYESSARRSRLSLIEVKTRLRSLNRSISITSTKYTNNQSKLALSCHKCGYEWKSSWASLSQGVGCPQCAGNLPLSLSEIRRRLKKTTPTVRILSGAYTNVDSVFKCKCTTCKHIWQQSWKSLQGGRGCPHCDNYDSRFERIVRNQAELLTGLKFSKARPAFTKGRGRQSLEIDCYNEELKLGIEPNGPHHYRLCYHNRFNPKLLQAQKRRDWRKRYQCWYHGVKLISVPYWIRDVKSYLSNRVPSTVKASG